MKREKKKYKFVKKVDKVSSFMSYQEPLNSTIYLKQEYNKQTCGCDIKSNIPILLKNQQTTQKILLDCVYHSLGCVEMHLKGM